MAFVVSPFRRHPLSLITAVIFCVLAATRCDASCGDYVSSRLDRMVTDDAPLRPDHTPAAPRCYGPGCSCSELPMPVVPTPAVSVVTHDQALPGQRIDVLEDGLHAVPRQTGSDAEARRGFPQLIDVPPESAT